ncbi:MAG: ABC transporter substrate-binding protein [Propionibacteriaceae bacterium]|nr:ABC transporter substrate-binding protein [Propionibacteriaceae bacterium]
MKKTIGLVGLALCLAVSGCAGAQQREAEAGGGSDCPVEVDTTFTGEARIAFQHLASGDLIVKDRGWLESCLPEGTITWSKADSGGTVVRNFGANAIDLGLIGSSPATRVLSAPLNAEVDVKVIWVQDVIGAAESLVARDSSITSLGGLNGKTIAVPFASTAHYSLQAALTRANMLTGADAPTLLNLEPDAMLAAWQRDEIDAAWVWDPVLTELKANGTVVLTAEQTADEGAPTYDLSAATTSFVEANPGFMKTWTALQDLAITEIKDNPDAAAESMAAELGIASDQVKAMMANYNYLSAAEQAGDKYLGGGLGADLFKTADFLVSQGEIEAAASEADYAAALYADGAASVGS